MGLSINKWRLGSFQVRITQMNLDTCLSSMTAQIILYFKKHGKTLPAPLQVIYLYYQ